MHRFGEARRLRQPLTCGAMSRARSSALAAVALASLLAGCGKSGVLTSAKTTRSTAAGQQSRQPPAKPTVTFLGAAGAGGISTGNTTRLGGSSVAVDAASVAIALHPGLTAAGRPKAVVIVDAHDWPAALAASALSAAPLTAPILYSEGQRLPQASAAALAAMRPTGDSAIAGAQVIAIGDAPAPPGYETRRIRAKGAFALAAKIAGLVAKLRGGEVPAAIVAGLSGPKALSMPAAGLAAESGAPILLVGSGSVPKATHDAILALHSPSLYAIGPPAAIEQAMIPQLEALAETTRVGSDGAVANAISVAAFTDSRFGWGVQEPGHGLVFARTSRPFDAPAAAPLSSGADFGPLLLLDGRTGVPTPLRHYLRDIQPGYTSSPESLPVRGVYNRGWLIGDEQAISVRTQSQIDDLLRSVPRSGNEAPPAVVP